MERKYWLAMPLLALLALVLLLPAGSEGNGGEPITLVAVGDILLDRGVRRQLENHGYAYPYLQVKGIFQEADIAFANLECPLTTGGVPVLKDRALIFCGDPENGAALREAGFTLLSLANNHSMDYGGEGLSATLAVLEENGILPLGAGRSAAEARQPVYVGVKGNIIGFLGYSLFPPEGYIVLPRHPQVARVDFERMPAEIAAAGENCDFLVVSFHWGREYDYYASEQQRELAYLAVDSGAELVLGHHPHVLQGIELYRDKLIFYSLGNFVFDRQIQPGTDETIILELSVHGGEWQEAIIIPVKIENARPRPVQGKEGKEILQKLQKYSRGLNTSLVIREGKGYLLNETAAANSR